MWQQAAGSSTVGHDYIPGSKSERPPDSFDEHAGHTVTMHLPTVSNRRDHHKYQYAHEVSNGFHIWHGMQGYEVAHTEVWAA